MKHTSIETGGETRPVQNNAKLLRFAVLIPHRDSRRLVEACRSSCFAAGLFGAWSFPAVVPLARLSRPLLPPELKALAASLRELTLTGGRNGWITAGEPAEVLCPGLACGIIAGADSRPEGALRFWGPVLDLPVPPMPAGEPVCLPVSVPVLCAALIPGGLPPAGTLPTLPAVSFRAAATANLTVKPLSQGAAGYSFRWKIGRLYWLPSCKG